MIEAGKGIVEHNDQFSQLRIGIDLGQEEREREGRFVTSAERVAEAGLVDLPRSASGRDRHFAYENAVAG